MGFLRGGIGGDRSVGETYYCVNQVSSTNLYDQDSNEYFLIKTHIFLEYYTWRSGSPRNGDTRWTNETIRTTDLTLIG